MCVELIYFVYSIKKLFDQRVPVYFMHGNRDFLIGQRFAEKSGVTLLPDPTVIELYGQSILLTHGDVLCTLDVKHQSYRKKVNKRWVQQLFLNIPLSLRRKLAKRLREKSQQHNSTAPEHITDVTQEEVIRLMKETNTQLLIHGHTHRPGIHDVTIDNQTKKRIVLGAWHHHTSVLNFHHDGHYQLDHLPLL